ncbi:MAG: TetR/AcrR family transcriptional regulator [Kosmotogaceae bacterium]
MPKETFFNLSEEKGKRVIDAAIDEFADYGYSRARINEIVRKAAIPKGSFYQYFENKKDLFKYVVDLIYEKKMKLMSEVMDDLEDSDIFKILKVMVDSAIKMAEDNPKLSQINDSLIANPDLLNEILEDYKPSSNEFMRTLIRKGIENGDVTPDIEPDFTAKLITGCMLVLGEEVRSADKYSLNEETRKKFSSLIEFIKNGIKRREKDD